MQLSKITLMSILALTSSTLAAPGQVEKVEAVTNEVQVHQNDKRFGPVVIALIKVIGAHFLSGVAKAAIETAKEHIAPEGPDFKDFDEARTAFTKDLVVDLFNARSPAYVRGIACFNGPYAWDSGSRFAGPISIEYKWDIYHTTYDCFEIIDGGVTNKGDGGYINVAYVGPSCTLSGKYWSCPRRADSPKDPLENDPRLVE